MRILLIAILFLLASVLSEPVSASVVVSVLDGDLRSIGGLVVGTEVFDVSFMRGGFDGVFSLPSDAEFWGRENDAQDAAMAIRAALNDYETATSPISTIVGLSPDGNGGIGIAVPFEFFDASEISVNFQTVAKSSAMFSTGRSLASRTLDLDTFSPPSTWAKFSQVSVVPEPGTFAVWSVLGLGFLGAGLRRRVRH